MEISTYATNTAGQRSALRMVGIDALVVGHVAPGLMPVPEGSEGRFAIFAPDAVFLNAAAQGLLPPTQLQVQSGLKMLTVRVAGKVSASGPALAVMDIAAVQDLFGTAGQLTRIDVKLKAGADGRAFVADLQRTPQWPAGMTAAAPGDAAARISNLSRAYRVNLTVLALVALFTGAFLVFSVLSLSVAKRAQQFALLGVLGLTGRERMQLVLLESGMLGLAGSLAGVALGTALAALALRMLGGDLGGGYFAGVAPHLQWSTPAALAYAALGLAAATAGGWWPARQAQQFPPAQTLKGLGSHSVSVQSKVISILCIAVCVLLACASSVF